MTHTLQELAELSHRLRRFRSGRGSAPPGADRLEVAGRLTARLGGEAGSAGTTALGEVAVGLARAARLAPAAVDGHLLELLAGMADLLEGLLGAVDDGRDPETFLASQDWWRYRPARPDREQRSEDPAEGPVLLLVASEFRRAALRDRFAAAGLAWEAVADPEGVLARLDRPPLPRWIVCDDQAPERHLRRLCGLLAGHEGARPPLVLLAPAAPGTPENLADRHGADLLWRDPFDPADLPG